MSFAKLKWALALGLFPMLLACPGSCTGGGGAGTLTACKGPLGEKECYDKASKAQETEKPPARKDE